MADRELCFGDRFTDYLQNVITENTDDDSIENELQLALSERQFLVLEVTGTEYTKLFSSVLTGADLLYNDEAHQITWLIWKAAKMATFCEAVGECPDGVGEAGAEGGSSNNGYPDSPVSSAQRAGDLLPDGWNCDEDHRFGMAVAIVEQINEATTEVFQAIEVLTNPAELAAEIGDNIPIASMASTALDVVNWIQDTAFEAYQLAWSQTVADELECDIFCKIVENGDCSLSFDDILAVYTEDIGVATPDFGDWAEWLLFVTTLPLTAGKQVVQVCSLLGLGALAFGSSFAGLTLGLRSLQTTMALAADDTNSDWSTLCDACPDTWEHIEDLTLTDGGLVQDNIGTTDYNSTWVDGTGWTADDGLASPNDWRRAIAVRRTFGVAVDWTQVIITYNMSVSGVTRQARVFIGSINTGIQATVIDVTQSGDDLVEDSGAFVYSDDSIAFFIVVDSKPVEVGLVGQSELVSVTYRGTGTNPFL